MDQRNSVNEGGSVELGTYEVEGYIGEVEQDVRGQRRAQYSRPPARHHLTGWWRSGPHMRIELWMLRDLVSGEGNVKILFTGNAKVNIEIEYLIDPIPKRQEERFPANSIWDGCALNSKKEN